jgi:hypothetical protein
MVHLDEETYRRLLAGTLPPDEARAAAEHLEGDCAACEAFLASRTEADAIDGRVDAALARAGPGEAGDDLEFGRIARRLGTAPPARAPAPGLRRWVIPAAAAVLVAGLAALQLRPGDRRDGDGGPARGWTGEKGAAAALQVRLRFLVIETDGEIEKGVGGERVAPQARLQFEIDVDRPADVALVRVPARGAPELVLHERLGAGRTAVSVDGRPAVFPLDGLSGPQRFVVIAAEGGLDPARVEDVSRSLAPPGPMRRETGGLEGLSLDAVEVTVGRP